MVGAKIKETGFRNGWFLFHIYKDFRRNKNHFNQKFINHIYRDMRCFLRQSNDTRFSVAPHLISNYREVLTKLKSNPECNFISLIDYLQGRINPNYVNIVLRHDVDFAPERINLLCEVEYSLGLRSSIHILVDNFNYPVEPYVDIFTDLYELGFDVGLHTTAQFRAKYAEFFRWETKRFNELFSFPPLTFSRHGIPPKPGEEVKKWGKQFSKDVFSLIKGTSYVGYAKHYDKVVEDSAYKGVSYLYNDFKNVADGCYLGGTAIILTHPCHWRKD